MVKCHSIRSTDLFQTFMQISSLHGTSPKVFLKDFSLLGDEQSGPEPARHLSRCLTCGMKVVPLTYY